MNERCKILKQNMNTRLLYPLQIADILYIQRSFPKTVHSVLQQIYLGQQAIQGFNTGHYKMLQTKWKYYCMFLADIWNYHTAVHLTRIVDWCRHNKTDICVLWNKLSSVPLSAFPWCGMPNTCYVPLPLMWGVYHIMLHATVFNVWGISYHPIIAKSQSKVTLLSLQISITQ